MSGPPSLLEVVLPRFDASEVHDVWVAAQPNVVFTAVKQVTVGEVRLLMPLEALRVLPGLLARRGESHDLGDELRGAGKDVEYLVFDDEGHDVLKLGNRVRCYDTITTFFSERLTGS